MEDFFLFLTFQCISLCDYTLCKWSFLGPLLSTLTQGKDRFCGLFGHISCFIESPFNTLRDILSQQLFIGCLGGDVICSLLEFSKKNIVYFIYFILAAVSQSSRYQPNQLSLGGRVKCARETIRYVRMYLCTYVRTYLCMFSDFHR